jgi:hypothetical protein
VCAWLDATGPKVERCGGGKHRVMHYSDWGWQPRLQTPPGHVCVHRFLRKLELEVEAIAVLPFASGRDFTRLTSLTGTGHWQLQLMLRRTYMRQTYMHRHAIFHE